MPADHQRSISAKRRLCVPIVSALLLLGGCATGGAAHGPSTPDFSPLDPAQQALDKALAAQAGDFAPRTIDAARRRITIARDILYSAANQSRDLTDAENERVQQLVTGARLDAKAALSETQAKAVQTKIQELQARLNGDDSQSSSADDDQSSQGSSPTGLGPSAFGDQRNQTGVNQ